jgi:hypothetical protein
MVPVIRVPRGRLATWTRGIDRLARLQHFEPETVHRYLLSEMQWVPCGAIVTGAGQVVKRQRCAGGSLSAIKRVAVCRARALRPGWYTFRDHVAHFGGSPAISVKITVPHDGAPEPEASQTWRGHTSAV